MPNHWRLNLDNVNHSKPVPSDTPMPCGGKVYYIVFTSRADRILNF